MRNQLFMAVPAEAWQRIFGEKKKPCWYCGDKEPVCLFCRRGCKTVSKEEWIDCPECGGSGGYVDYICGTCNETGKVKAGDR